MRDRRRLPATIRRSRGTSDEPLPRDHRRRDGPGAEARPRPDRLRQARPVRRPVPAADPRSRRVRARGAARRVSALGHLAARPAVRAGDHHDGTVLAGAIRMVRACSARRSRPGSRRPRSRRSAPAARRSSKRPTKSSSIASARSCSARSGSPTRASARRSPRSANAALVEIISIIGYYTLIGNTLNVFQVPLPEGEEPPFPE